MNGDYPSIHTLTSNVDIILSQLGFMAGIGSHQFLSNRMNCFYNNRCSRKRFENLFFGIKINLDKLSSIVANIRHT